jgi:hypothetical protein
MRRHLIIGRFGPSDRVPVPTSADEVVTQLDLVASARRLDHGIGQAVEDLRALQVVPTEIGLDLLITAAHVYAADTRVSRASESQDTWTREIRLVVPVNDPARWNGSIPLLERMLHFLTGDRWTLGFRSRPSSFTKMLPTHLPQPRVPPFDGVSLFSGGLDSLIGAIDLLEAGKTPLLISHASDGAASGAQNRLFEALSAHYLSHAFNRLRVWMGFDQDLVKGVEPEDTTRGRSFLFFALAVFAGTGLGGAFNVRVPENGLIALNVPLDPLRLGALSTRTTHPFYMARWTELLAQLGIPGRIDNPYWNKTKGEMVTDCANPELLRQLVPGSLSCSSPTKGRWQGRGVEHCGYCLPCLIRRAALGGGADGTVYTLPDLGGRELDTRQVEGKQIRSLQLAIERLRKRPNLAKLLIHIPGPLSDYPERLNDFALVYGRGMEEIEALLVGVRTRPL